MVVRHISRRRRVIHIVLFVLFLLFGIVQLNDPDPALWFVIYCVTAGFALISNYRVVPRIILWLFLIALLVYSMFFFHHLVDWLQTDNKNELFGEMVYEKPYLEGTREFLGLVLCAAVFAYLLKK